LKEEFIDKLKKADEGKFMDVIQRAEGMAWERF